MAKIIVHNVKDGVIEREETNAERMGRESAQVIETQIEIETQARNRDENKKQRMQRQVRLLR